MKHVLTSSLTLPLPCEQVFAFFSDPANLGRITPPGMQFRMLTSEPVEMKAGTTIDYRIRVFAVPMRWRSLIEGWDPPHEFVDVQLAGPYKSWVHTHRFIEQGGGTVVEDLVEYELPFGPLGRLVQRSVARQLEQIFAFRRTAIEENLLRPVGADDERKVG